MKSREFSSPLVGLQLHRLKLAFMRVLIFVLALIVPVLACAPFYPTSFPTALTAEQALIVWDKDSGTEHFIRKANFETESPTLGFVVPTPSKPEIAETDDSLFFVLDRLTQPRIVYQDERVWVPGSLFFYFMLSASSPPDLKVGSAPVRVFEQGEVAGQEYVVLQADKPESLMAWLADHDFPFAPQHQDWVKPYVEQGYFLTAFKYTTEGKNIRSKAVRMSFSTDKPWYPYREPKVDRPPNERQLRLYLLTENRVEGRLPDGDWPAELKYSAATTGLPPDLTELTNAGWLTAFDDFTKDREGAGDLSFVPATEQSEVRPADKVVSRQVRMVIPLEIVFLCAGILLFVRRKRKSKTPT